MSYKKFTKKEIDLANNSSILDYLNTLNLDTKKAGKTLKIEGYGGLYVEPVKNKWNCFSAGKGGGPIQLVMFLENKTWVEAMKLILNKSYTDEVKSVTREVKKLESKEFVLPKRNKTYNHMIAYLIKTRKINKDIVYKFIKNKTLYEDKNRNCVFVGYDKEGKPRYAGLRGTNTNIPFKGEVANSRKEYSFNITNKEDKTLYVFESPIELMSYMTLYKKHCGRDFDFNGLSLAGTSDVALERFLKENNISNIYLCLDNDKAGIEATKELKEKYKDDYTIEVKLPKAKDWNEELVCSSDTLKKTDEIENIDEWDMEL